MTPSIEDAISSLQLSVGEKLFPLIEAKPPINILAKAHLLLARAKVPNTRKMIFSFFNEYPNEKDSIKAIAELGGNDAVEALVNRAKIREAKNRDLIAELLGNFRTPESINCLKELLGDEDRFVRFQAAHSLFNVGGQNAALTLCKYISDPDEWISMTILKLLCKLKEYETIPYLIQHFTKDTDIRRKALMVSFLAMFKSVTLVNVFDEGLRSRDARLKANSIEAIGELELPMREIEIRIMPFLNDPNNRIRANALLILARMNPEMARAGIIQMVESGDNQLRRSAAYILGQIPPQGNEEYVKKLISDPVDDVKKRMILSLRQYPFEFVQGILDQSFKDPNKWIRKAAIDVAKEFPNFPKAPILKLLKTETVYPNLVSCIEFFATHPDEEAARIIKNKVQDPRHQVATASIKALAAIQGLEAIETLANQIMNVKDIRIITEYTLHCFKMGSINIFQTVLEKATQLKKPWTNDRYLPAIEACLELITSPTKVPAELATKLTKTPLPKPAKPPQAQTRTSDLSNADGVSAIQSSDLLSEVPDDSTEKVPKEFIDGVEHYNMGEYAKAKEMLKASLTVNPSYVKAHLYIGLIAAEEKNFTEAKESLSTFLKSEPNNQKAAMLLGKVYKSLREWENAAKIFRKIVESNPPPSPKILLKNLKDLGLSLIFMKNNEEAINILTRVCNEDPSDLESGFYLATAYFRTGNNAQAKAILNELISRADPNDKIYEMIASLNDKIDRLMANDTKTSETSNPSEEQTN